MLPLSLAPMLATTTDPFDSPDFIYEIKWDGYRCLAYTNSQTHLQSRNQKDITYLFPELTGLHQRINRPGCLLDGEVIALRDQKPSFLQLQKRAQLRNPDHINRAARNIPVVYVIFDLLYVDNNPVYPRPWYERRQLLEECLCDDEQYILSGYIKERGISYFEAISELRLEGVLAKQVDGVYLPGKRSRTWCKFKRRLHGNFVVCGYSCMDQNLSSLILGSYWEGQLRYMGMVGSGFTQAELRAIERELQTITVPDSPFSSPIGKSHFGRQPKKIVWTKPLIVCEVEYLEITDDGGLRHPSFQRFRPDWKPSDCQFGEIL